MILDVRIPQIELYISMDTIEGNDTRDIFIEEKRIVAMQIPPASRGIPTMWRGATYARENESLCPLPLNKLDLIRNQIGMDWSREIILEADMEDLDQEAVDYARQMFVKKKRVLDNAIEILEKMSDVEILGKMGLLIKGKITNAALILLGKQESLYLFDGFIPRITWTLYNGDGTVKAYEHFDMPLLLAVDKVYAKIRNEKYRYIAGQLTLFPDEVHSYEADVVKEILNNCIAHSNYQLRGKINIQEFEDKLVFMNEGGFIPETVERALEEGYKPPYYRNTFLCNAMVNLYMIDTNSMGIPMMYQVQRNKCFPLPTYDLSDPNRVKVTLFGKILDKNYTQLLHANESLNLREVFLLDKVQKKELISKQEFQTLKKAGFLEGRYPNVYVSFKVADIVGQKEEYIRNKGLKKEVYYHLVLSALEKFQVASVSEIYKVLVGSLPAHMDNQQQHKKVSNILQSMKKENLIDVEGTGHTAKWKLKK